MNSERPTVHPGHIWLDEFDSVEHIADPAERAEKLAELLRDRETRIAQLQTALNTRVVIEQAKGMLAERWHTTPAEAFSALRAHARSHNLRLRDLAQQVVQGNTMPARDAEHRPGPVRAVSA